MAGIKKLQVVITGDSKSAERAMTATGNSATGLSSKFSKFQKVAGASFLVAGGAAVAFGKKSADTYKKISGDISKLERLTGLTAEEASKLRFAFQQSGISAEAGSKGIAAFSKKVTASKDGMKDFGFNVRDASGKLLPMNKLIDLAADRLAGMENGAEKNALAMKLFGKGGLDMVKVLGKGSKGLAKLSAEAEKYGLVLTEDNVEAVKKSVASSRDQEAAYQGLQLQIGMHVLPLVTKLTTAFATAVPKITKFAKEHQGIAKVLGGVVAVALAAYIVSMGSAAAATIAATWPILAIIGAIGALVLGFKWAYENVDWFRGAVDKVSSFITGTVIPVISRVAEWLGTNLPLAFRAVSDFITGTVLPVLDRLWRWFNDNILPALQAVARVVSWVITYAFGVGQAAVGSFIDKLSELNTKLNDEVNPALKVTSDKVSKDFGLSLAIVADYIEQRVGPSLSLLTEYLNTRLYPAIFNTASAMRLHLGVAFGVVSNFVTTTLIPNLAILVDWLTNRVGKAVGQVADVIGSQLSVAFSVATAFFGAVTGAASALWTVLTDIVQAAKDVIEILSKVPSALNGIPGSGIVKDLFSSLVPGFAAGGRPPVGMPYWVGENGPELRIDDRPGTIIPNSRVSMPSPSSAAPSGGMGGVTATTVINVHVGTLYGTDDLLDVVETGLNKRGRRDGRTGLNIIRGAITV